MVGRRAERWAKEEKMEVAWQAGGAVRRLTERG
jgi:hypothetical protein